MKIGDYIRTKQWGIAKVNRIYLGKCSQIKNNHNRLTHHFEQIGETSPDIIDVIEVGDYVNGELVASVDEKSVEIGEGWHVKPENIKSIVTHEQFNSIKYEVI